MEYPFFDVPRLGGGMLIAIVAIVHVVIAHFAVGGGLFMAVTHTIAVKRNDRLLFRYLRDHARFVVLFAFVAGALTGVGIWVTIGLVSPPATSRLIHLFVWGWAIEWCFFAIEIASGYVYYLGFGRIEPRRHVLVGWIYAISAFLSLVIINGILAFMLTPGDWLDALRAGEITPGRAFWLAFFNDTYWPSLVLRTFSAMALAAIFVAVIVNLRRDYTRDEQRRIINIGAYFLIPLALMVPVGLWYFAELPPDARTLPIGGAIAMTLFMAFGILASVLIGFYAYFGLLRARRYINLETSLLLLAIAFVATGSMEFVREGIRKPYLIYGMLYSNGIPATDTWLERLDKEGVLANAPFVRAPDQTVEDVRKLPLHQAGALVFDAECKICHEPDGANALGPLVRDKTRAWLQLTTSQLHDVRHFMPPFMGNAFELQALVEYEMYLAYPERAEVTP